MTLHRRLWTVAKSLQARIVLFLSLAILPLGMIALFQTASIVEDAAALEQQDILARTVQTAHTEGTLFRRAHGAATALGRAAIVVGPSEPACAALMADFVASEPFYVHAGFVGLNGQFSCSSTGTTPDVSEGPTWLAFLDNPRENITVSQNGTASGQSVVIATAPIWDAETDVLMGMASVSLPHSLTDTLLAAQVEQVDLALLDENGTILTASTGVDDASRFAELHVTPSELGLSLGGQTFEVTDASGVTRLAAIVPLIDNQVFVLGLWNEEIQDYSGSIFGESAPMFPILIWCVALAIAALSLNRLVLRHLRVLRERMAAFSFDDPGAGFVDLDDPPQELRDIAETYNRMIDRMLGDRSELSDSLEEKEILLREVHHRVKNNLQLIASILNMQMRSVPNGDAKRVLRRVQDRVMSLSTIHKALYTGSTMAHVRGDRLLEEVVQSTLRMGLPPGKGIVTTINLDPLDVDPDQAVPLALLANETVTNAAKYIGRPSDGTPPSLSITLTTSEDRQVVLTIENTLGTPIQDEIANDGTGLGARLVEAFVAQLGGTMTSEDDGDRFRFQTTFTAFALEEADDEDLNDDEVVPSAAQPAE